MIKHLRWFTVLAAAGCLAMSACTGSGAATPDKAAAPPAAPSEDPWDEPFLASDDLFDLNNHDTLGLQTAPRAETFTVVKPTADSNKFNHGVVLTAFKGKIFAQWQSSRVDEDAPETVVRYATSDNGESWGTSSDLTTAWDQGYKSSGGWWTDGEQLVAYINVWPAKNDPKGGYVEYRTSTDGVEWSAAKRVTGADGEPVDGIIEQDTRSIKGGRLITTVHLQPGLIATPYYTDDPLGVSGWTPGKMENLPHDDGMSRELEPAWYERSDGAIVMIFRDQGDTFKKLASVSTDRGETWTTPVVTNVPDSRAKQSAGNLPDGTAFQVSNPTGEKRRFPLVIALSKDGHLFDTAYTVRAGGADLQPQAYEGQYKSVGFSYPKSFVWGDHVYVGYATNKEDVEVTRIPVSEISLNS